MYDIKYDKIEESKDKQQKKEYWDIGIGLQEVDYLKPSDYLVELSKKNIDGELSYEELKEALHVYYTNRLDENNSKEADFSAAKITEFLDKSGFTFNYLQLKNIHRFLFAEVFNHAGEFREYNISKSEPVLNGFSVQYADFSMLTDMLEYDFKEEQKVDYAACTKDEIVEHIADFISNIWQVHPFAEGNTRTVAVFTIQYLKQKGIDVTNDLFKDYSRYFRDALVIANYSNIAKGISEEKQPLRRVFDNLINGATHKLRSEDLIKVELFNRKPKKSR